MCLTAYSVSKNSASVGPGASAGRRFGEATAVAFLGEGDVWSPLSAVLMAYGGLGPSEPLALRLDDVRERTMLVHRTASRGMARALKNRLPYRTVVLEPFLKEDIALAAAEPGLTGHALLLSDELGEMLDGECVRAGTGTC